MPRVSTIPVFHSPGFHRQTGHSPAQRWARFLGNPRCYPLVVINVHKRVRRRGTMYQAFQGTAGVGAKTLAPIARPETPAQKQSTASVERPHELRLPGAEMCFAEACPTH